MKPLCRTALNDLLALKENDKHEPQPAFAKLKTSSHPHPGLLLAKGLTHYPEGTMAGQAKAAFIGAIADLGASDFYVAACQRWQRLTGQDKPRFATLEARLEGRLYIGVVRENPLETGITTAHAYGMPMIPGSSVKGICRAAAREWQLPEDARNWLFGRAPDGPENEGEAGGLVFHDAWWIPEGHPFTSEVITPHHPDYYKSYGATPATDFDSPIPAPQIASRGRYYFVIEGQAQWTRLAINLLRAALSERGIGSKRSSGYGFFVEDSTAA